MAQLSLYECAQSELDSIALVDGQMVVCLDTGNIYRDTATMRIPLGSGIKVVNSLPLVPISDKLYLLLPNSLYIFTSGDWICLSETKEYVREADDTATFPTTGEEGVIYVSKNENRLYRWNSTDSKYVCVGSNWRDIKWISGGDSSNK